MAVTTINVGTPNGGNGDTLRDAFVKTNTNFDILSTTTKLSNGDLQVNGINVGQGALVTTNFNNTAVGHRAGNSNSGGNSNTAIGSYALQQNISNSNNTAIGTGSLEKTKGDNNTAVGASALFNNSGGQNNVSIGVNSSLSAVSVSNNTSIGVNSLFGNTLWSNCTALGYDAGVSGSNEVQLGNSATTPYAYQALNNRSDLRDKTEVRDTVLGLDFINELRPVDYKWDIREDYRNEMPIQGELSDEDFKTIMDEWLESCKIDNLTHDGTHTRTRYHHGLIAQEVQDVIEASGVDFGGFQDHKVNGGGDVLSIGYTELIAPMIKAIQELTARINVLENN